MSILTELRDRFRCALAEANLIEGLSSSDIEELLKSVRCSTNSKFGDYQVTLAMPLGKCIGCSCFEVATKIVECLAVDDFCEPPRIAGPGVVYDDGLTIKDITQTSGRLKVDI